MDVEIVNTLNNIVIGGSSQSGAQAGTTPFSGASGLPSGTYKINYYGSVSWVKNMVPGSIGKTLLKTQTVVVP